MSLSLKVTKGHNLTEIYSKNLLEDESIKLFYEAREAINTYAKTDGVANKRSISEQVLSIADIFLKRKYLDTEKLIINKLISDSAEVLSRINHSNNKKLFNHLENISEEGTSSKSNECFRRKLSRKLIYF